MDADRFDTIARSLTAARSRRAALGGLLAGTIGFLGWFQVEESAAKNCKKIKNKKKRKQCVNDTRDTTHPPVGSSPPLPLPPPPPPPPPPPGRKLVSRVFTSTGGIAINGQNGGKSTPYPSTIVVSGLTNGRITDINLLLNGFNHTWRNDVDILLAATHITDRQAIVMSDAGGEPGGNGDDAVNANLVLDDQAPNALPATGPLGSGVYRPINYEQPDQPGPDTFPEAPSVTRVSQLNTFNGLNPNGTWQLFVMDDVASTEHGNISSWALDIVAEVDA